MSEVVVIFEIEPAPGEEDAWDFWYRDDLLEIITDEDMMMDGMRKKTILEGPRRVIDVMHLKEAVLIRECKPFLGRQFCSSDAEWEMCANFVISLCQRQSRVTRVTMLGDVSEAAAAAVSAIAQTWVRNTTLHEAPVHEAPARPAVGSSMRSD